MGQWSDFRKGNSSRENLVKTTLIKSLSNLVHILPVPCNQLSRQLRNVALEIPANHRRTIGTSQTINQAADEWSRGMLGKLMEKGKMKMSIIRGEINSLKGKYKNKEIRIMGHKLMLVKLNNEEEHD